MRRVFIYSAILVFAGCLYGAAAIFPHYPELSDLKQLAEERLSQLLNAKIRVENVRVKLFNQIAVRGLEITQEVKEKNLYLLNVDEVLFRYSLRRLWERTYQDPNVISLTAPEFRLRSLALRVVFLKLQDLMSRGKYLADQLELKQGRIDMEFPGYGVTLTLEKLRGRIRRADRAVLGDRAANRGLTNQRRASRTVPDDRAANRGLTNRRRAGKETWQVDLETHVKGLLEGPISVRGTVDQAQETVHLEFRFKNVKFGDRTHVPVSNAKGLIELKDDELIVRELDFLFYQIPVSWSGVIRDYETKPNFDLRGRFREGGTAEGWRLMGGLNESSLKGVLMTEGRALRYEGIWEAQQGGFRIENLKVEGGYRGRLDLRWVDGSYRAEIEHFEKGLKFVLRVEEMKAALHAIFNHARILDTDVTGSLRFRLVPSQAFFNEKLLLFDGSVETDYLILDFAPIDDLEGNFRISPESIDHIELNWGATQGYHLQGKVGLDGPYPADLKLLLRGLNLGGLDRLLQHPLPEKLLGKTDGEIKLTGGIRNMNVEGFLAVTQGQIGDFDYDRVQLRFYGSPRILVLKDSKLWKGDVVFRLEGLVDFSKSNIFQDVRAVSSDRIVVWQGASLGPLMDFRFRGVQGDRNEWGAQSRSRLGIRPAQDEEGEYIAWGPKLKF